MFLGEAPRDPSLAQPLAQAGFLPQGILLDLSKVRATRPQIPTGAGHSGRGVVCGRSSMGGALPLQTPGAAARVTSPRPPRRAGLVFVSKLTIENAAA